MNDDFIEFKSKFNLIKQRGYIKSLYKDNGGAGKMFETLLNKKLDNKSLPDFKNIEIKTTTGLNKYPITLFSCTPSKSTYSSEKVLEYLINNYGYNVSNNCKCLMINIQENKIKYCKNKYGFMIKVSYKWKKIYLCIFYNRRIFDTSIYWHFNDIKNIFDKKLKYLVCVRYHNRIINNEKYFYYERSYCYCLKNFEDIIFAIKQGIISINLNLSISNGILRYHGINFVIYENDLEKIYNVI